MKSYKGFDITASYQVMQYGHVYANCDSLADAMETIDEFIEAAKDREETERELMYWLSHGGSLTC